MKAVRYHAPGGFDVLVQEDVPRPAPAADELLVRVHAAGVNPVDDKLREGMFGKPKVPFVLGFDVSGVVEKVGEKVTRFKAGDEVFALLDLARGGGYAEYAVVKESAAAAKPKKATHVEAAAVPVAGLTAWQALVDVAKLDRGQTVLIHGGSGGVGTFAVQIAKARGARVIATASAANQDLLRELGADVAVDYKAQRFEDLAKDVDVVLDPIGGETQKRSLDVLKKGGILVSIVGMPDQELAKSKGVRATGMLVKPDGDELAVLAKSIDEGKIKVIVSKVFPLADAAKAHEQIHSQHTRGKLVLDVAGDATAAKAK
jgi:NADPH:quinone reductase-like Zn-dependent oxidoreductase